MSSASDASAAAGAAPSAGAAVPPGVAVPAPQDMIVYDREGELLLRQKSWLGNTYWRSMYAVLSRSRRSLLLFAEYFHYERHLLELNGWSDSIPFENEYASWTRRLSLQHASLFVCSTYFRRKFVFELCGPDGIFYFAAPSERAMRQWLSAFEHAGVLLKSDEKPLLIWRPPGNVGNNCFLYTRTSSALPEHDYASVRSWATLSASLGWNTRQLLARASASLSRANPAPSPVTIRAEMELGSRPLLTNSEWTPDAGFGKHGALQKLGRSLFARFLSDASASADPSSPFFDPRLAAEMSAANKATSPYNHWVTRFYRTLELASGRPALVAFRDRDQTQPSRKRKHCLSLFQARVFDLHAIHREVELECHAAAAAEEADRWRAKIEAKAAARNARKARASERRARRQAQLEAQKRTLSRREQLQAEKEDATSSSSSEDEATAAAVARHAVQRAKDQIRHKATLQRKIQAAFVAHSSLPEPLPSFAPHEREDFAVYTRMPSPKFYFFRAPTPREKQKWIQVLKNLAADGKNQEAQKNVDKSLAWPSPEVPNQGDGIPPTSRGRSRTASTASRHLSPSPALSASPVRRDSVAPSVGRSSILGSPISTALARAKVPDLDEREVHVVKRDFYAMLGVDSDAPTDLITLRYKNLTAELLARLVPKQKTRLVLPAPQPASPKNAEEAEEELSVRRKPGWFASHLGVGKNAEEEMKEEPNAVRHDRIFSFDLKQVDETLRAEEQRQYNDGRGKLPSAVVLPSSTIGALGLSLSPSPDAPRPMTAAQVQQRLKYKLSELREVWRILRDPVRRCQYDSRREALDLGALQGVDPSAGPLQTPGSSDGVHLDMLHYSRDRIRIEGLPHGLPPLEFLTPDDIDLESVLQRAARCFQSEPRPRQTDIPLPVPAADPAAKEARRRRLAPKVPLHPLEAEENERALHADDSTAILPDSAITVNPASLVSASAPPVVTLGSPLLSASINSAPTHHEERKYPEPKVDVPISAPMIAVANGTPIQPAPTAELDQKASSIHRQHSLGDTNMHIATIASSSAGVAADRPPSESAELTDGGGGAASRPPLVPKLDPPPSAATSLDREKGEWWCPGDVVTFRWRPKRYKPTAAAGHSASNGSDVESEQQKVKLELCLRKLLGRVQVVQLLSAATPDTGEFSFLLPLSTPPRRGYFLRLTLLPSAALSEPVVTESPSFEIRPLVKEEKYVEREEKYAQP